MVLHQSNASERCRSSVKQFDAEEMSDSLDSDQIAPFYFLIFLIWKVDKKAMIRNRYNQIPHPSPDNIRERSTKKMV